MVYPMGIMSGLGSPFASSIREAALVGNRERVDPYKGTKFEGFTGLGNDGYGSLTQGPMDNVLSDGFFVNDPRRTTPLPSALTIAADLGAAGLNVDMSNVRSSLKNILADRNMTPEERVLSPIFATNPGRDPDKADFYAFKNTLRDPGDMGRYVAPGEEMSYEDFVKFGRPANLAAAEAAGYGGGSLLVNDFGNKVSLGSLIGATPGASEVPSNPSRPDSYDPNAPVDPGFSPNLVDPYARPRFGMLPQPIEINPNYRPGTGGDSLLPPPLPPGFENFVKNRIPGDTGDTGYFGRPFNPNMYQRPMRRPFGFGGRPMNPFMGMGIGMMNPMGMGMFGGFPMRPPMFGGYGGYGGGYGGYGGGYNMMRPPMGFGLGGANPYGMNPYSNFGRPNPYPQPSYNMPSPYSSGMNFNQPNFMQQQQGGYGSYQQPSGYGNYGGMQNPYQPQQFGYNPNNSMGYGQRQAQLMGPSIQGPNGMSSQDLVPM